jgi:hypothetical protein
MYTSKAKSAGIVTKIGENGVILDKIFIFQLFHFVFLFYEIFFYAF